MARGRAARVAAASRPRRRPRHARSGGFLYFRGRTPCATISTLRADSTAERLAPHVSAVSMYSPGCGRQRTRLLAACTGRASARNGPRPADRAGHQGRRLRGWRRVRATRSRREVRSRATSPAAPRRLSSSRSTIVHPRSVRAATHAAPVTIVSLRAHLPPPDVTSASLAIGCSLLFGLFALDQLLLSLMESAFGFGPPSLDVTSATSSLWRKSRIRPGPGAI